MSRDPDLRGTYGRAWKKRRPPVNMEQMYGLASWLIRFQGMYFNRRTYVISCVSLEGGKKAYKEATHELQVIPVAEDTSPDAPYWTLDGPPELIVQFHGLPDAAAAAVPHVMVKACVDGALPPTRARAGQWKALLTGLLRKLGGPAPRFL